MRKTGLIVLALITLFSGGFILLERLSISTNPSALQNAERVPQRQTLCPFVRPHKAALNSFYLARIMTGSARALLIPKHDASCLPREYNGQVDFFTMEAPEFIPYAFVHSLDMQLSKSTQTYLIDDLMKDPASLKTLGLKDPTDLRKEIEKVYGHEALSEKFVWLGLATKRIHWSKEFSEVPPLHPYATVINSSELKKLLAESAPQFIDVRESQVPIKTFQGAFSFNKLSSDFRRQTQPPEHLPELSSLLQQLDRTTSIVLFDKNETRFAAYNLATVLGKEGFKNLYILRKGLDDWLGRPVEAPFLEDIRIISGAELIELRKTKTPLLLDVRNKGSYRIHHIKDSKTSPVSNYINVVTARSIIEVLADQRPIVIYGKNEYDWRPYKVIKKLIEGQPELKKEILWYRQGMSDAHFNAAIRHHLPPSEKLEIIIPVPKDMERVQHKEGDFEVPDDPIEDVHSENPSPNPTENQHGGD